MNARRDPDAPIFLVGFMGAGKSTVGRALAARWGWDFEDTDVLVTRAEGRAIEAIFRESGDNFIAHALHFEASPKRPGGRGFSGAGSGGSGLGPGGTGPGAELPIETVR